jgi:hypothetical protein
MVFALLPKSEYAPTDKQYGSFMQENLTDIVESVARYDGMLVHLSSDDKGVSTTNIRLHVGPELLCIRIIYYYVCL